MLATRRAALSTFFTGMVAATTTVATANAADSRTIGQISGSGLVFKDTLVVESFDDPKVKGVTLYVSNFERPLTERLSKDFFTEPSYASVTAVKTGPVEVADNIDKSEKGEVSYAKVVYHVGYLLTNASCGCVVDAYLMPTFVVCSFSPYLKRSVPSSLKNYVSNESTM